MSEETKKVELKDLLNRRILTGEKNQYFDKTKVLCQEFKVLEISPSNEWIKLQNLDGRKFWKSTKEIVLLEVLEVVIKPKN